VKVSLKTCSFLTPGLPRPNNLSARNTKGVIAVAQKKTHCLLKLSNNHSYTSHESLFFPINIDTLQMMLTTDRNPILIDQQADLFSYSSSNASTLDHSNYFIVYRELKSIDMFHQGPSFISLVFISSIQESG
jgi:hypothetical protein